MSVSAEKGLQERLSMGTLSRMSPLTRIRFLSTDMDRYAPATLGHCTLQLSHCVLSSFLFHSPLPIQHDQSRFLTVASFSSLPPPPKHSLVVSQCLCPAPPSPHVNWTSTWTHWVLHSPSSSAFSCFARCCSYFRNVVIKHYDWGNLEKKTLIWGVEFQRVRVHSHRGGEHRSRQAGMEVERQLRAHALRQDCKADGVNGMLKPTPTDTPPPTKTHLLVLPSVTSWEPNIQIHELKGDNLM